MTKLIQSEIILVILSLLMVLGTACSKKPTATPGNIEKKLQVYASFYPMYDFTKQITKDKADIHLMVPPGVETHDWEPGAKMIADMEKADIFIYNGISMEPWAEKLIGSVKKDTLVAVETSKDLDLLKHEEHEEDSEAEEEHGDEDTHGEYDPHVWLDPTNAIKQAENIKNAFVQADAQNKDFYESNFKEFKDKLTALDNKFKQELSNVKRKDVVVAHEAFSYLTNRYGLTQLAVSGLSPQEEPSAAKMAKITEFAKEHNVKTIFFETLTSPKISEVLAKEIGASTAVLNPVEGLTSEEIQAGKDYISVMEENLQALIKALGE